MRSELLRFALRALFVIALAWLASRIPAPTRPAWSPPEAPAEPGVLHAAPDAG